MQVVYSDGRTQSVLPENEKAASVLPGRPSIWFGLRRNYLDSRASCGRRIEGLVAVTRDAPIPIALHGAFDDGLCTRGSHDVALV